MTDVKGQAKAIVDALEAKPELFCEVMRQVQQGYELVGPWEESADREWVRWSVEISKGGDQEVIAQVESGGGGWWSFRAGPKVETVAGRSPQEAMAAADAYLLGGNDRHLRGAVVILDGGPVEYEAPDLACPGGDKGITGWLDEDGTGRHVCRRQDKDGNPVAWIGRETTMGHRYYAQVNARDLLDGPGGRTAVFDTVDEAKLAVDTNLGEMGYVWF